MSRVAVSFHFCVFWVGLTLLFFFDLASACPLLFIPNVGQFPEHVRYVVWGGGQTLWLTQDALWLIITEKKGLEEKGLPLKPGEFLPKLPDDTPQRAVAIKLGFHGANPRPMLEPLVPLETRVNYFLGNDPAKWRTNVPAYSGVRLREVYPGIDVEVVGEGGQWTWRVRAQPWADLSRVQLEVVGVQGVAPLTLGTGAQGLQVLTPLGTVLVPLLRVQSHPASIGVPQVVEDQGHMVLNPFQTGTALVPNGPWGGLAYMYVFGGSEWDGAYGIAVDGQGSAYVTGVTWSGDFPTTPGAYQTFLKGNCDAFVAKLDPTGSSLVYATFLGGSELDLDAAYGIAVDGQGSAYVTGVTWSRDFPTTPGAYRTFFGGYGAAVAFAAKLGPSGSHLVYSTFLDLLHGQGLGIAVDGYGYAYIAGSYPYYVDPINAFVVKLDPTGSSLVYSVSLGGVSGFTHAAGIGVDRQGSAYVTGVTWSRDFPTTPGAYQTFLKGNCDAFVAKLDPTGSSLVYATFLGGSESDAAYGIAVDGQGSTSVIGETWSADFPTTPGAYDSTHNGLNDIFLVKLHPDLSRLAYASFFGSGGYDTGSSLTIDGLGNVYFTGCTAVYSPFSYYPMNPVPIYGLGDAFIAKVNLGAPQALGTLKGRVTDRTTGKGLAGALVSTEGGSTATDQNGYYTLSLPAGTYTVTASAQGYSPASRSGVKVEANKTTTVNLALEPLPVITFEPYPFDLGSGVSVMEGGVRYVYYRLKDARGNAVPNAEVRLKWGESVSSSATGEVGIPLSATRWGGPGTYTVEPVQEVQLGGQVCEVRSAPRLTLTVVPRDWERHWEFGAGVSTSAGLTAYAKAQASAGLDFGLEKSGAILLGRNFQTGVGGGVQVGPSFKLAGVIEGQVGAMTELLFIFTGEEGYRFPQGTTSLEEKKALATLLIFTFAQAAGTLINPIVGALLEALWTSSSVYQSYLETQGISFGVQASTSVGGEIAVGFKEGGGSKTGLKLNVGPGLTITAELAYLYYPKASELGLRLQNAVDWQLNLNIGDVGGSTSFPVRLAGFEVRCDLSGSPKALILILSDNREEIRLRINRGDLNKNGKDDVQEVLGQVALLAALAAGASGGSPSAVLLAQKIAEETNNFVNLVNTIGGEYEIIDKSSRKNVEFKLEIELAWEVRIGLGGSLTFEETLEWVKERGALRQGKVYPFEKYTADAYLAPDARGLSDIVNAVTRGLWELAKDVVGRAVDTLKAGAEWVVETTAKTVEGVVVGTMTLVGRAGAVAKDTVVSIFTWVGRRVGVLKPGELTWLAEPRALSVPLPWEGLLVVGGFYKFEPEGLELAQPATLVLTYADAVLPPGVNPQDLDIYLWDPAQGGWHRLYATVDPDARSLSAQVTRLGTFAIGLDLPPAPPQNLVAHATATSVFLTWESQGEADLLGFHVYRATQSGGPYQRLTPAPLTQTQYLDTDVVSGQVYYYVVTAVDAGGNESDYSPEVAVTAEAVLYRADFGSLSGWQATGLWHVTQAACLECALLQGSFAYFARSDTCTYEVLDKRGRSIRSQGTLTSPTIQVPSKTYITLVFDYFREVETNRRSTLDRTYVQIRLGKESRGRFSWSSWRTIWSRSSKDPSPECGAANYTFNTGNYTHLQIRFVFDSVNAKNNQYRGWAVDNLVVKPASTTSLSLLEATDLGEGWDVPDSLEPEELQVVNVPNPVRDVRTTTFTVLGVEAEALRVEVYDLSGRLVWKAEALGNKLVWHTEDLTGLPLANGVYLYLAYVKVDDEWIRVGPQKLVILR